MNKLVSYLLIGVVLLLVILVSLLWFNGRIFAGDNQLAPAVQTLLGLRNDMRIEIHSQLNASVAKLSIYKDYRDYLQIFKQWLATDADWIALGKMRAGEIPYNQDKITAVAKEFRKKIETMIDQLQGLVNGLKILIKFNQLPSKQVPFNKAYAETLIKNIEEKYIPNLKQRIEIIEKLAPDIGKSDYQPQNQPLKAGGYYLIDISSFVCTKCGRLIRPIPYDPKEGDLLFESGRNIYTPLILFATGELFRRGPKIIYKGPNITHAGIIVNKDGQVTVMSSEDREGGVHIVEFTKFLQMHPDEVAAVWIRPLIKPLTEDQKMALTAWVETHKNDDYPAIFDVTISPFKPDWTLRQSFDAINKTKEFTCAGVVTGAGQAIGLISPGFIPNNMDAGELSQWFGSWYGLFLLIKTPMEK
ncbi:MAG: hypothetical protein ABH822_01185 [Patescibacteria group bacterium]